MIFRNTLVTRIYHDLLLLLGWFKEYESIKTLSKLTKHLVNNYIALLNDNRRQINFIEKLFKGNTNINI